MLYIFQKKFWGAQHFGICCFRVHASREGNSEYYPRFAQKQIQNTIHASRKNKLIVNQKEHVFSKIHSRLSA